MLAPKPSRPPRGHASLRSPSASTGYLLAVAFTALAIAGRYALDPWLGESVPYVTIIAGVAAAVWCGGYRAGILAAFLGYLACDYWFIAPRGSLGLLGMRQVVSLLAYLGSCAVVIVFGELMRRARADAHAKRELLRISLASIGDAVITTDVEGRIAYLNGGAETLTGWTQLEAQGRPLDEIFRIIDEGTRDVAPNPALQALREGSVVGLAKHTILIAKDGSERSIDDSAAPIRDAAGNIAGCVLVFRDVDERRATERALERSEQSLRDFFENAPIGMHWVGPDGTIQRVNQAELDMLGYTREEYVGRHMADFHADRERARQILRDLRAGETLREWPARLACKDGSFRHVLISSNVLWEDGEFVHTRSFTRDVTDRKATEEARTLLASIVSASDDAIISKSLDGVILSWNASAERLFGYTASEAIGRPITMIIPPELRDEETNIIQRLARGERIEHFETVRVSKTGRRIDIALTISPLRDDTGRVVGASKVARDVTELKAVAAALREREDRLRLITDAAPALISYIGTDERYRFVNRQYELWFGLARESVIGKTMTEVLGESAMRRFRPHVDRVLRGEDVRFTIEATYRDGVPRWINAHYVPDRDASGRVQGFVVLVLDVSEQKRSGLALQEAERQLQIVTDSMSAPVTRCSRDLEYLWVGKHYATWLGTTPESIVGKKIVDVIGAEALRTIKPHIERVLLGEEVRYEEHVNFRGLGPRWISAVYTPTFDRANEPDGWVAVVIDIDQRKRVEEALKDADRRKDEFLATLAHELRNPLAPVRNSLEIMKRANEDSEILARARDTMDRQMAQMERLIDDLLDVSRITRNKLELRKEAVELAGVIQLAVETCRPLAEKLRHEVTEQLPPEPIRLHGDPVRLAQVFGNLLHNACKYTAPEGRISITAQRAGNEVVVSVKDDGVGIPEHKLPYVFDMFMQVDPTRESSHGGLGIGLTLVKHLVGMHGGSVEASSAGPGRGTEFRVRLPIAASAVEEQKSVPPTAKPPPCKILVVDDNKDSADSLAVLLRLTSHEADVAYDGLAALEAADRFRPDVVLLDLGLPELSGFEVCARMRAEAWGKEVVLVALTGWGQEDDRKKSRVAGFDAHLVKPVDHAALMELLASLFAQRRGSASAHER